MRQRRSSRDRLDRRFRRSLAVAVGFEPTEALTSHAFEMGWWLSAEVRLRVRARHTLIEPRGVLA